MQIVSTYDQIINFGSGPELVKFGQTFEPPGTGIMNKQEHAQSMIRQGSAVTPEAWKKTELRRRAEYEATRKIVDAANAEKRA